MMAKIEKILFDAQEVKEKWRESICGMYMSEQDGKPHIHLFEITENKGVLLNANLHVAFQAIRDQVLIDTPVSNISWSYTNGIHHSEIQIKEQAGYITQMHLSGGDLGGKYFKRPLQEYEDALNSAEGFEHSMTSGHRFLGGNAVTIIPVPVKGDGLEVVFMKVLYGAPALADPQKLIKYLQDQEGYPQSGQARNLQESFSSQIDHGLHRLFATTKETALKYLPRNTAEHPMNAANMNYSIYGDGRLTVTNGYHRTTNLVKVGAPFIPIELSHGSDVEGFHQAFGWRPADTQKLSLTYPAKSAL